MNPSMPVETPRSKKECFERVVAELNLDTRDPFTRLFAIACALVDHRDSLVQTNQHIVNELMDRALKAEAALEGMKEQEWLEDQLIEVLRLASKGLFGEHKDDSIDDTLRLHGIRLLLEGQEDRYAALLERVQKRQR